MLINASIRTENYLTNAATMVAVSQKLKLSYPHTFAARSREKVPYVELSLSPL